MYVSFWTFRDWRPELFSSFVIAFLVSLETNFRCSYDIYVYSLNILIKIHEISQLASDFHEILVFVSVKAFSKINEK